MSRRCFHRTSGLRLRQHRRRTEAVADANGALHRCRGKVSRLAVGTPRLADIEYFRIADDLRRIAFAGLPFGTRGGIASTTLSDRRRIRHLTGCSAPERRHAGLSGGSAPRDQRRRRSYRALHLPAATLGRSRRNDTPDPSGEIRPAGAARSREQRARNAQTKSGICACPQSGSAPHRRDVPG